MEPKEDEYIKDGFIYCKNCNTLRCVQLDNYITRCLCQCQSDERDRQQQIVEEQKRVEQLEKLKKLSLIGERYKNAIFDTTQLGHNATFDNAFTRCKRYCKVSSNVLIKGLGIYIYGAKGTGKTHLTACIANELLNQRKQVLFTNFFEISRVIKATYGNNYQTEDEATLLKKLAVIDFLIIDDIGTERVKDGTGSNNWLQERIFDVLNKRYNMQKPTIFTSNHSIAELMKNVGIMEKTIDRIASMSSAILHIEGKSYRLTERNATQLPF